MGLNQNVENRGSNIGNNVNTMYNITTNHPAGQGHEVKVTVTPAGQEEFASDGYLQAKSINKNLRQSGGRNSLGSNIIHTHSSTNVKKSQRNAHSMNLGNCMFKHLPVETSAGWLPGEHEREPIYDTVDSRTSNRESFHTAVSERPKRAVHFHNDAFSDEMSSSLPGSVNSHLQEEQAECPGHVQITDDNIRNCCKATSMMRSSKELYTKTLPSPIVLPDSANYN